ncbi:MAG TPA: HNH endonuclease domain-containing protein [Flavobacterium sp.]|nr:HNH endonuclease domain-containing protein [Flavobacterium sp.]
MMVIQEHSTLHNFSYFEYLFGLGKFLCQKYEYLFKDSSKIEQEDSIGFNIVNICLELPFNEMEKIPSELGKYNLTVFEDAVLDSIDITYNLLKGFISLKMNKIKRISINHSEFQIVSIIGKIFHSKYNKDLTIKTTWPAKYESFKLNIPYHYLYDIIREHWKGSGDSKAFLLLSSNRYESPIPKTTWQNVFEEWFNNELEKREKVRVNVNDKAILFLKYLYTHSLSAYEEISDKQFDIEHIIPVDRLKEVANTNNGLPISAFSNLCLLETKLNREKGSDTFYEHFDKLVEKEEFTKEQAENEIEIIEKYTHTKRVELEFISNGITKENFDIFLRTRFDKILDIFFTENDIQ